MCESTINNNNNNARAQTSGLANGAGGCPQASLSVCKDDVACGIKGPAAKQRRITAEDMLLPFPPLDAATRWSVSSTCALPV